MQADVKSRRAMKTISEVAEILDLPTHVLRFWETKFPEIEPLKRGGGRRFYRPEDITALMVIKELLHVRGFTIKGASKVLPDLLRQSDPLEALKAEHPAETAVAHSSQSGPVPEGSQALSAGAVDKGKVDAIKQELESIRNLLAV
jgi:DNA-binding transcriptional MerR regulator